MPTKPLEISFDIDDDLYELTEGLRRKIILAFKGILKPDELTPDDFKTVVYLLNETHSYWLHCKHHAPRRAEVIRCIKEIEVRAKVLLQLLDTNPRPPKTPKSVPRARQALGVEASRPPNMTDEEYREAEEARRKAEEARRKTEEERHERKVARVMRARRYALKTIDEVLSTSVTAETDIGNISLSLADLRDFLSTLLALRGEIVEKINTAPGTTNHLEKMITGVAERIFKPHGLSQGYVTHKINGKHKRISGVAIVSHRLAKRLSIGETPPSLTTVTEIHKKLYPGWRGP
jgi:hypothetical protein